MNGDSLKNAKKHVLHEIVSFLISYHQAHTAKSVSYLYQREIYKTIQHL